MSNQLHNIPTQLVILGATGDLMAKKIVPALLNLHTKKQLPSSFKVVGFARREMTDEAFRDSLFVKVGERVTIDKKVWNTFSAIFSYHQGSFENESDYRTLNEQLRAVDLKWGVCTNKLFYLAVPPQYYETIFRNLASSGLTKPCSAEEGWTRIIVEKPFGKDLKTAKALDMLLGKLFKETQIYRIDHYLAKEMLQNILAFRFSNNLFEMNWGNQLIERVHIRLLEKIGAEDRGSFYDSVGTLRDVGQNHLLQMLALITMERPTALTSESVRKSRADVLEALRVPSLKEIVNTSYRAQYDSYRAIAGVSPESQTETYFKVQAFLDSPRWAGVPFILESGKRLAHQVKEIEVVFKHPSPCSCPSDSPTHFTNKLFIRLEPKEGIAIQFWVKKPGLGMEIEERTLDFTFRTSEQKVQYTEEYEKLLVDCIGGDQTLFISSKEVREMWKYIDPILALWQKDKVPLHHYAPDTDKVVEESKSVERVSVTTSAVKKEIGVVGLGKMGANLARRLMEKGWKVTGYNRSPEVTRAMKSEGLAGTVSLKELVTSLPSPRIVWLMVPAGKPVDDMLFGSDGLVSHLKKGDIVVDGGNSLYKDSAVRYKKLKKKGIHFMDAGVSGGPSGARNGASIMIGGDKKLFTTLEPLFSDLSAPDSYQFFEGAGAGHFVKMVHNGIEYGMMQAIAEGVALLKKSKYKLDLTKVSDIYNHGSVIESRLVGWLQKAFILHGDDLNGVTGSVAHTGEGAWTVQAAKELKVKAKIIEGSLQFRIESAKNPSFTGRVLSALRAQFGGHDSTPKGKRKSERKGK
ncbi:MAG: glucose-6-phosphate dehydrogenase [Candidatus Taylorbacteria bacterium]|nr:glucose-6-phosphate dehydrogenase [Candidatus Taylorbacteria bacterium]